MEQNKNKVAFMSTDKEQITDLYEYLINKNFKVYLNEEKMSVTKNAIYTISTTEIKQKLLKAFAIQYAGYNGLDNILIIDTYNNARSINSLAVQPSLSR